MTTLSEHTLERLAEVIRRQLGLHFPRERWPDLARGLQATCRDLQEPELESCADRLLAAPLDRRQVEVLGRNLTVPETYFFREGQAFRFLEKHFLPELLARRRDRERTLRFWSAACATGEEPYSLAILLRRNLPDLDAWNLTLLATDLNTASLRKAEQGVYGDWSFRTDGGELRQEWFTRDPEGRYRLRPEIRRMVTFSHLNLAEDPYPSLANNTNAMDVIFCRNVLMYFSPEMRQQVLAKLQHCLVEDGLLVLGTAESGLGSTPGLLPVRLPDLVLFRRQAAAPAAKPPSPPPRAVSARPTPRPAPARPTVTAPEQSLPAWLAKAYSRGDYEAVCRRAAGLQPGHADFAPIAMVIARACANAGNLAGALSWAEAAIARRRFDPEAHYLRAMILLEKEQMPAALDALRTTLYLDPDFVPAHLALGNAARRAGERKQADRHFRNALLLLERYADDDLVPHTEQMHAGSLREAVMAAMGGPDGTRG